MGGPWGLPASHANVYVAIWGEGRDQLRALADVLAGSVAPRGHVARRREACRTRVLAVTSYLAGLGLMLSLIVAIGAQNLFVLRQGLRREHVGLVVFICAASDAVLTVAGIAGMGAVVSSHPCW